MVRRNCTSQIIPAVRYINLYVSLCVRGSKGKAGIQLLMAFVTKVMEVLHNSCNMCAHDLCDM